jgi:uncharacterized RDD family membrane protein YckC
VSYAPPVPYAGLVSRTLALTFDTALLTSAIVLFGTVVGVGLSLIVPGDTHVHVGVGLITAAIGAWWLILGVYLTCFWTLAGQTPGMRLLGLRVTSVDGGSLRLGRALLRLGGMVLAALPLMAGYALILVDARRQGLHDKLARTLVLYVAEENPATLGPAGPEPLGKPTPPLQVITTGSGSAAGNR